MALYTYNPADDAGNASGYRHKDTWGSIDTGTYVDQKTQEGQLYDIAARRGKPTVDYFITYGYMRFDTSSIPDGETVISATLKLWVDSVFDADGLSVIADWYDYGGNPSTSGDWVHTIASANAIAAVAISGISAGAYKTFTLDNVGNISKAGYTGIRVGLTARASDAAPTADNGIECQTAGDAHPPVLEVITSGGSVYSKEGIAVTKQFATGIRTGSTIVAQKTGKAYTKQIAAGPKLVAAQALSFNAAGAATGYRHKDVWANIDTGTFVDDETAEGTNSSRLKAKRSWGPVDYYIDCAFLRFDTSSLDDALTITNASLSLWIESLGDIDDCLVIGDWYDFGGAPSVAADWVHEITNPNALAGADITALTVGAYHAFILQNFSYINRTGITGIRLSLQPLIADAAPSGDNGIDCEMPWHDHPPFLTVNGISGGGGPSGASQNLMMLGVG